jgi:hypothetical protein
MIAMLLIDDRLERFAIMVDGLQQYWAGGLSGPPQAQAENHAAIRMRLLHLPWQ